MAPARVTVPLELTGSLDRSHDVAVGTGLLSGLAKELAARHPGRALALVTDSNLRAPYAEPLVRRLEAAGLPCRLIEVAPGEESKSLPVVQTLLQGFLEAGLDRAGLVLALGGGVVCDLAGFAAGCYMRGVGHVLVPTTLLAQVDAAVGGKVAVNIPGGKNYCGLFKQPEGVYIDTDTLATLPRTELAGGLAEAVKTAVIADEPLFSFMEENAEALLATDPAALLHVVERCVRIKARVVAADEREAGPRRILNYGHTVGHAVEEGSGHALPHGLCVAYGMRAEARLAEALGLLDKADRARQNALLDRLGLAVEPLDMDPDNLLSLMVRDKKARAGALVFALPGRIGECGVVEAPPADRVREALQSLFTAEDGTAT